MFIRIEQLQTSAGILQSDARSAAVGVVFRIVGIVADEGQKTIVGGEADVDVRLLATAYAMFERILSM